MTSGTDSAAELASRTERRRQAAASALDGAKRTERGQFFTPAPVAEFIASLPQVRPGGVLRVLDPGAGVGSLSAALVARILRERIDVEVELFACELDEGLWGPLRDTLDDCKATAAQAARRVTTHLVDRDFIEWATYSDSKDTSAGVFDLIIMNPPYRKLGRSTRERRLVEDAAVDVSNLYAAFLSLAVTLLGEGGQVAAITPRSFSNGPYFRSFRKFFLDRMDLDRLHVFQSRTAAFADSGVLQENVVFTATRRDSPLRGPVVISTSTGSQDQARTTEVAYQEVVYPSDAEYFLHISTDEQEAELAAMLAALPATLTDLGLKVSTGRVVDFRATDHLRQDPEDGAVPLIYPLHMREGRFRWPVAGAKKCNAIMLNDATWRQTFPEGHYTVVKRLSSKEEKRRVVAAFFDPEEVPGERIGFENHVNVFHENGEGLSAELARGLCLWLNSTLLDRFIRRFNGHTQINATDLRTLRYPSAEELTALGAAWGAGVLPSQEKIDSLVSENVAAASTRLAL